MLHVLKDEYFLHFVELNNAVNLSLIVILICVKVWRQINLVHKYVYL